ncbi:MAG: hypothetical protein ABR602_02655, partial [Gemmatimonadales bacterium]
MLFRGSRRGRALFLALVFALSGGGAPLVHACATMGSHAAADAHAVGQGDHAGHGQPAPQPEPAPERCECVGQSCCITLATIPGTSSEATAVAAAPETRLGV